MDIHEYQAKAILDKHNINVPKGILALTPEEAVNAAKNLPADKWVVKAQVHAGGRGKAGGIKLASNLDEVMTAAKQILGMKLVTHQTGPEGKLVKKIYIETASNIEREYYLSAVLDRSHAAITFIFSTEGGMDIEETSAKSPEKILKVLVDPAVGLQNFHIRKLSFGAGFDAKQSQEFSSIVESIYKAFLETDASQIEINPLILSKEGNFIALDAKFNFDTNALFRHPDIASLEDADEQDKLEAEAAENELSYVRMNGNIGCMVNGAGLAMATMDIIKLYGGEPANFLDIGGGADAERVRTAFKIITSDLKVEAILINIFGGIMRCDIVASGVLSAIKDVGVKVPVVVRLEGTNAKEGKEILEKSGLEVQTAEDLTDAAQKVVQSVKAGK